MFAVGSLIASLSHSVVQLFIGESLIEGVGAAMMLPATLSILSATFHGRERGVAFAVWGSVAGGAGALGPWIGGILTTNYSWRWAFRVNVVIAPLAILAGIFYVHESKDDERRRASTRPASSPSRSGCSRSCSASSRRAGTDGGRPIGDQSIGGWNWPLRLDLDRARVAA